MKRKLGVEPAVKELPMTMPTGRKEREGSWNVLKDI